MSKMMKISFWVFVSTVTLITLVLTGVTSWILYMILNEAKLTDWETWEAIIGLTPGVFSLLYLVYLILFDIVLYRKIEHYDWKDYSSTVKIICYFILIVTLLLTLTTYFGIIKSDFIRDVSIIMFISSLISIVVTLIPFTVSLFWTVSEAKEDFVDFCEESIPNVQDIKDQAIWFVGIIKRIKNLNK